MSLSIEQKTELKCGHDQFHEKCIGKWVNNKGKGSGGGDRQQNGK